MEPSDSQPGRQPVSQCCQQTQRQLWQLAQAVAQQRRRQRQQRWGVFGGWSLVHHPTGCLLPAVGLLLQHGVGPRLFSLSAAQLCIECAGSGWSGELGLFVYYVRFAPVFAGLFPHLFMLFVGGVVARVGATCWASCALPLCPTPMDPGATFPH